MLTYRNFGSEAGVWKDSGKLHSGKVRTKTWSPCPFKTYTPEELRAEIEKMQSESASLLRGKNIRIVICASGYDGKSSTINNIVTALEGKYSETASIGIASGGIHVTQKYIEYQMFVGDLGAAKNTCYVLCDTPGLTSQYGEVQTEAIKAVIEGKFCPGDKLDYGSLTLEGLGKMQVKQPRAACVIFVIAATKVHFTVQDGKIGTMYKPGSLESLNSILDYARHHDIKTACLMTKCDQLDYDVMKDVRNIYYSKSIENARLVLKENFQAFPENRIFPIVNYTKSLHPSPYMMVQTLFALKHIVHDVHSSLRRTVKKDDTC